MNDILVSIQDFIPQDRLLYCPDPEMGERLFYLKSPSYTQPTYQVSTNDPIVFELKHDGTLIGMECLLPRVTWHVLGNTIQPNEGSYARLIFSEETILQSNFDIYADILAHTSYTYAYILLGSIEPGIQWIYLSKDCIALIKDDRLKGFYIFL